MIRPRYVLVTAAYNEERHIADTLRSVSNQSLKPQRWVIVSDGSTDQTDEIARDWASRHPFIEIIRVEKSEEHDFATKVRALRRGFERLADIEYEFIGVLDADLSFEPNYFERVMEHFCNEPRLGIAGGDIEQLVDGTVVPRLKDLNSVAGAVQLMRRECFEQTGGLPALKHGGEDAAIEIAARMHGWETRTFPELKVVHPLFQLARSTYRVQERPYLLGGLAELVGFVVGKARDHEPSVDRDVVRYLRREQLEKLKNPFTARRSK
jgi:glycosyltransferase involved in cell wall biosynthesis